MAAVGCRRPEQGETAVPREPSTALAAAVDEATGRTRSVPSWPGGRRLGPAVLVVALASYFLLRQAGQLPTVLTALTLASPPWTAVAVAAAVGTFLASAVSAIGAAGQPLPFLRTVAVELAGTALNRLTPAGLGRAALLLRYYERGGRTRTQAATATAVGVAAGTLTHAAALLAAGGLVVSGGRQLLPAPHFPRALALGATLLLAGAAFAGVVSTVTRSGGRWRATVVATTVQLARVAQRPRSAVALVGGALAVNLAYIVTLSTCLSALGGRASVLTVAVVYLGASTAASASAIPGGLGVMEVALVAGLTGSGVPAATAVAGVLLYRLLTYWLPILPGLWCLHGLRGRGII